MAYSAGMEARQIHEISRECVNATHCMCGHAFSVIRSVDHDATHGAAPYLTHVGTGPKTIRRYVRAASARNWESATAASATAFTPPPALASFMRPTARLP